MKKKKPAKKITKDAIHSVIMMPWGENNNNPGGFELHWVVGNVGFGCLTFIKDKNSKVVCSTECMSEDFVNAIINYFFKNCVKYKD